MPTILVDGIKDVVFHNGIVRVECLSIGANGEQQNAGTLLIPGNVTGPLLQTLANAVQELDKKIRDHVAEQAAQAAAAAASTETVATAAPNGDKG
jgi:hypothetical protein